MYNFIEASRLFSLLVVNQVAVVVFGDDMYPATDLDFLKSLPSWATPLVDKPLRVRVLSPTKLTYQLYFLWVA
jgi:hypothetical protein